MNLDAILAEIKATQLLPFAGGRFLHCAETFDVFDPSTGDVLVKCPLVGDAELDFAVASASRAGRDWAARSWAERAGLINKLSDALEANADFLSVLLTLEQGRPLRPSRWEVEGSAAAMRVVAAMELPPERLTDGPSGFIDLHYKPLGVVAAITPWNAPLMLSVGKIASALVLGNTVVLKPSEFTPLTVLAMARLAETIFPPGVFNVLSGAGKLGAALVAHPGIAKVGFTGSTRTGKHIAAAAADTLKRVTLELGGNDAAIILDDADPATAGAGTARLAFSNSGQYCAGVKRIYVHDSIFEATCEHIVEYARSRRMGSGLDPETTMGPIQNRPQFEKVCAITNDAIAAGGRALTGGAPLDRPGYFLPPTVITGVGPGTRLVDEEQFGPVVPVIRYSDVDDAVRQANAGRYGLGGSVWTGDEARGIAVASRLECGNAWINQHGALHISVPMPFAKESGLGIEFGREGLTEYAQRQVINVSRVHDTDSTW